MVIPFSTEGESHHDARPRLPMKRRDGFALFGGSASLRTET